MVVALGIVKLHEKKVRSVRSASITVSRLNAAPAQPRGERADDLRERS